MVALEVPEAKAEMAVLGEPPRTLPGSDVMVAMGNEVAMADMAEIVVMAEAYIIDIPPVFPSIQARS
jgi:hypothetical protein